MENRSKLLKIMVVDDNQPCLQIMSKLLTKFNYEVVPFESAGDALYALQDRSKLKRFDLALIEPHVGSTGFSSRLTGSRLLEYIQKENDIVVFTMCAHKDNEIPHESNNYGTSFLFTKPLTAEKIDIMRRQVLQKRAMEVPQFPNNLGWFPKEMVKTSTNPSSMDANNSMGAQEAYPPQQFERVSDAGSENLEDDAMKGKKRMRWDSEIHDKFLLALEYLKDDRITPITVRRAMNVEGITTKQVASHLQIYRRGLKEGSSEKRRCQRATPNQVSSQNRSHVQAPGVNLTGNHISSGNTSSVRALHFNLTANTISSGDPSHVQAPSLNLTPHNISAGNLSPVQTLHLNLTANTISSGDPSHVQVPSLNLTPNNISAGNPSPVQTPHLNLTANKNRLENHSPVQAPILNLTTNQISFKNHSPVQPLVPAQAPCSRPTPNQLSLENNSPVQASGSSLNPNIISIGNPSPVQATDSNSSPNQIFLENPSTVQGSRSIVTPNQMFLGNRPPIQAPTTNLTPNQISFRNPSPVQATRSSSTQNQISSGKLPAVPASTTSLTPNQIPLGNPSPIQAPGSSSYSSKNNRPLTKFHVNKLLAHRGLSCPSLATYSPTSPITNINKPVDPFLKIFQQNGELVNSGSALPNNSTASTGKAPQVNYNPLHNSGLPNNSNDGTKMPAKTDGDPLWGLKWNSINEKELVLVDDQTSLNITPNVGLARVEGSGSSKEKNTDDDLPNKNGNAEFDDSMLDDIEEFLADENPFKNSLFQKLESNGEGSRSGKEPEEANGNEDAPPEMAGPKAGLDLAKLMSDENFMDSMIN